MKYLAFALALLASPLSAQTCAPADVLADRLSVRWGETVQATADNPRGPMFIFANTETGTWTITVSQGGMLCIVAAGGEWEYIGSPSGEPT